MRRRITLYIDGRLADIDDASFVVFNWRREDTDNPAVIRNSWSNSVTLPGTPDNDAIFSHAFRCDRRYNFTPDSFDPSARTPFAIYQETGEILVSGYCKLDSVARSAAKHSYKVTLYGGLGSLLYSLAYDESGNRRTLASLDFLGGGASELDFPITAQNVQDAWDRLGGDTTKPDMWDVVNFAPCYNGIPDGDFQADKALVRPADLGWPDQVTEGGKTYETQAGAALATLPDKMDEWQTKDLRAYLQRPVLSLTEFLKAIAKPENNGGWTLDLSELSYLSSLDLDKMWITLPMIPKAGTYRSAPTLSVARTSYGWHTGTTTDEYTISGVQTGDNVRLRVSASPVLRIPDAATAGQSQLTPLIPDDGRAREMVTFYQLIGYDGNGVKVAASKTLADYWNPEVAPGQMASYCGYTPDALNTSYYDEHQSYYYYRHPGTSEYERYTPIVLDITGAEMERVELIVKTFEVVYNVSHSGGTAPYIGLWKMNGPTGYLATGLEFAKVSMNASAEGGALRSGMLVTKQMLLGGEHTPADYLTAIIKAFNLYLEVNDRDKTAALHPAITYFDRLDVLDFSKRVDAGREVNIVPLNYDAKWYDFKLALAEGAFGLEYRNTYGIPYGIQRVDTGYDFDASAKDVLGGPALRGCVPVSKFAQQLCDAEVGGSYVPSPFISPGGTYNLVASDGSTLAVNVTPGAPTSYLNTRFPGYDMPQEGRPEFCKADGGGIDGQDCLVWLVGWESYPNFRLTDDDPLMPTIAGGLCWLIAEETLAPLDIPTFSTLSVAPDGSIISELAMGQSRELAVPGVRYDYNPGIYSWEWERITADRLNVDTKVVRVKADLTGLQVGPGLLRKFVWWDGCLWSINAIENYSLCTYDLADVELVQVHNINNYQ